MDPTMLLDNEVDLHSYQPASDDILKISDCARFVYVGGESDGWVDDALKIATNKDMKVINLLGQEEIHDEHGITSFLYEEKKPFDYDKFMAFLENDYPKEIILAKEYVWFYDDDIHVQLFEQAGRNASVTIVSNWVAAFGKKEREREMREHPEILEDWDEKDIFCKWFSGSRKDNFCKRTFIPGLF